MPAGDRLRVGVLVSGRGSNLQALLDASSRPDYPAEVVVVISDRERAAALDRARAAGVEGLFVNTNDLTDPENLDLALVPELTTQPGQFTMQSGDLSGLFLDLTSSDGQRRPRIQP